MPDLTSILRHSPNGIVMVDDAARIQSVNPAFRSMFHSGDEDLQGHNASECLDSDCFEKAIATGGQLSVRGHVDDPQVHYRAEIFRIEGENRYCGIFVDTTEEERARAELLEVKGETLARAEKVIRRQMQTAQEIAGLLGETTAETKVLLTKLTDLFRQEETS